ncbi:hypothetical protein E2C01_044966 [Portunus trituberculatus]|uniref:Uncharacterized protein n=1 Tax=Portunus trituberculatus TaxID=210409 RepID=A0A5B7FZS7_PORTR|nr:hypothetical protein [Portunus trituberculatus]
MLLEDVMEERDEEQQGGNRWNIRDKTDTCCFKCKAPFKKESDKQQVQDRVKDDSDWCEYVFGGALKVEEYNIEKFIRMGKKQEGKTRPTLSYKLSHRETPAARELCNEYH